MGKNQIITMTALLCLLLVGSGCSAFKSKSGPGGKLSEADLDAQREGRFGSGNIPLAEGEGLFKDVYFAFDSYAISDAARQDIEYNAEMLRSNPDVKVQIEGHCDERGTAEYNLALGNTRARAVRDALLSAGVSGDRLSTMSYGEELPINQGHDESAWALNRRAHFSGFRGDQ